MIGTLIKLILLSALVPTISYAEVYDIKAKKDPGYKYYACVNNESIKYSKLPESAEVAAMAAIESCSEYEKKHIFREGIVGIETLTVAQKNELISILHEKAKPFAIKVVMDERLKAVK